MSILTVAARFGGVALAAALLFDPGVGWAQNAHFINANDTINKAGELIVSWKEAGLGNNQNVTYEASAQEVTTCNCVTKSGNCPSATNKTTTSGLVSASGTFNSGKNGSISQSLTVEPLSCPESKGPTCPGGQVMTPSAVTYSNITLADVTNNVDATGLQPTQSATFFTCP